MEFKIERYQGSEEGQEVYAEKQTDLFQARIEERRQKRNEQLQKSVSEQHGDEEEIAKHKTKKKKRKDDCDVIAGKKKKRKHNCTSHVESGEVSDMESTACAKMSENNTENEHNNDVEESSMKKHKVINSEEAGNGDDDVSSTRKSKSKRKKEKGKKSKFLKENDVPAEVSGIDCNDAAETHCETTGIILDLDNLQIEGEVSRKEHNSDDIIKNGDQDIGADGNNDDVIKNGDQDIGEDGNNDKLKKENHIQGDDYFPILGKHSKVKKTIVKRSLPRWLAEPVFMSADINSCKVSIKDVDFLSEILSKNLLLNDIEYLFPVQFSVIDKITAQNTQIVSKFPPRDICVQAPTGSGKTLAYVLPIIDVLSKYIIRQLYCLVVVPSKDLAVQVHKVFETYVKGTNLKVALASGLKTFPKEQEHLVTKGGCGSSSKVDIVVCTPGRLVDHLKQTPGFDLRYLRFLVVDEADRLLGQDYSSWLDEVKTSVQSPDGYCLNRRKVFPINASTFLGCQMPFQKLLFSATLTQNPEKLAALELFHPMLFTSRLDPSKVDQENGDTQKFPVGDGERFIIPEKLEEKMVVVEADEKPLVLVFLMLNVGWKGVLCFTNSIAATHRLCLLLQSFEGFSVAEFSSNLSETQRKGIIRDFNNGKVDLLISSDAMARGMDIDTVRLVVNYDTAANAKTYVHRVGRTARAGKKGCAMTILHSKEVYHFKLMMKKLSGKVVPKLSIRKETLNSYQEQYENALSSLQDKISLENRNANTRNFMKRT